LVKNQLPEITIRHTRDLLLWLVLRLLRRRYLVIGNTGGRCPASLITSWKEYRDV
jgi:hypothetical protein